MEVVVVTQGAEFIERFKAESLAVATGVEQKFAKLAAKGGWTVPVSEQPFQHPGVFPGAAQRTRLGWQAQHDTLR